MNGKWLFYDYVWKIRREWIWKTRKRDREKKGQQEWVNHKQRNQHFFPCNNNVAFCMFRFMEYFVLYGNVLRQLFFLWNVVASYCYWKTLNLMINFRFRRNIYTKKMYVKEMFHVLFLLLIIPTQLSVCVQDVWCFVGC